MRTPAVLVLALLAGLVAMHGLSGIATAGATHQVIPVAAMDADMASSHAAPPVAPPPDSPHHGSDASAHHPCLAAPVAAVALAAPADMNAAALSVPRHSAGSPPARARADRSPPDLNDLCVSRT